MVIDVVYNISLLLTVGVIFAVYPMKRMRLDRVHRVLVGFIIAAVGLLIMSRPAVFAEGIVFDGRSILLGTVGMFFGAIPVSIAAVFMIPYRIMMGGDGAITGVLVTLSASAIGSYWHYRRFNTFIKRGRISHLELYLVGLIVHVVMILSMLFFPRELWRSTFLYMTIPVLGIYPLGFYLFSMLLYRQLHRVVITEQLQQSERRFKLMFEQAPIGITVTDSVSGKALEVNRAFLDIIRMTRDEFAQVTWIDITHPDDLEDDKMMMKSLIANEIDSYHMDKRYRRPDGSYVWAHMAITAINSETSDEPLHLCMVMDITARKEMESAILWANRHDVLTGIENRQSFEEQIEVCDKARRYPLSVLIGDLNGLKVVNDAFGRETGDDLLIATAKVLQRHTEHLGVCARIGGDEFGIMLPETEEDAAWRVAEQLQAAIGELSVRGVRMTMSFGVATKRSQGESLNEISKQAENMLSRSKLTESPSAHSRAVHTIINTLHEKNRREELHSRRVSVLSVRLAEAAKMGAKEITEMRTAGLLHDIGKIAIDEAILNKVGKLTAQEWEEVKRHPETGWHILGSVGELGELATYVLSHHERMDGKGYPRGLKGDAIPIPARIIAIADAYDAMTAERTYRKTISNRAAASELKRCAGTQFDADLARLFVEQVLDMEWDALD
jgi:diguanylate cyclase (GGDEF)-like protein/PAS domain S-box-containing protein